MGCGGGGARGTGCSCCSVAAVPVGKGLRGASAAACAGRPEGPAGTEAVGVSGTRRKASSISDCVKPFFSRKLTFDAAGELRT